MITRILFPLLLAGLLLVPAGVNAVPVTSTAPPQADRSAAGTAERAAVGKKKRKKLENRVVKQTNKRRKANGCKPLKKRQPLRKAARKHSNKMAKQRTLSHQLPGEAPLGKRVRKAGYNWSRVGENVAYGYATPKSVVRAWMDSPGHRRNILDCKFKHIGVGLATGGGQRWWTQNFGAK